MTGLGTQIGALLAAGAVAVGGLLGAGSDRPAPPRTALVVDAALARDGRALVDPRLRAVDADIRLPRTQAEALTDVRYFSALGYRIIVAGPRSTAAAGEADTAALRATGLTPALAAVGG